MIKKNWYIFGLFLLLSSYSSLFAQEVPRVVFQEIERLTDMENGFHTIPIDNKEFLVCIDNGKIETIKRTVVPDAFCYSEDSIYINFLEQTYADYLLRINSPRFNDVKITKGSWDLLERLNENATCEIKHDDHSFTISLTVGTQEFSLWSPINYQKFNPGTREDIEKRFIKELLSYEVDTLKPYPAIPVSDVLPIGNGMFVLRGASYLSESINSNTYLFYGLDGSYNFIVDMAQPIATIANMMVCGVGYQAMLDMTVALHEYGSTINLEVAMEQFRQYCIHRGCKLFWGFEENVGDVLQGALFCHNEKEGYEHIVRISCHPSELGNKNFVITARASLFVPTTNVSDVYKTE